MCYKLLLANVSLNDSQLAINRHPEILAQPALSIILGLLPRVIYLERPVFVKLFKFYLCWSSPFNFHIFYFLLMDTSWYFSKLYQVIIWWVIPCPPLFLTIKPTRAYGFVCLLSTISLMSRPYNRDQHMFCWRYHQNLFRRPHCHPFTSLDELNWLGVRAVKEVKAYSWWT